MENKDIKMLKELIHTYCECEEIGRKSVYLEVTIEQEKALENLLQAYKQDFDDGILNELERLKKENKKLISDNLEYQRIQDIFDERTYRKKYLEERRKEEPNLLYPDADEIYQRYYKLKKENEELSRLNEKLEMEYNILLNAKVAIDIGSTESVGIEFLEEYIPKSVIQDKVRELDIKINYIESQYTNGGQNCNSEYLGALYQKQVLKELLNKGE